MSTAPVDAPGGRIGLLIEHDPAVWLPGPSRRSRQEWLEGAYLACASDFEVIEESEEASYLLQVLTQFVDADLDCDFRFLRMRELVDLPVTARVSVAVGTPSGQVADTLTRFDPDASYFAEPLVETIDEERGLRRAIAWQTDDGMQSVVRYHRSVPEWGADVVVASAGADLRATALTLGDLDALARSVWFVDERGTRK